MTNPACPTCGAPLPADAPSGACPKCLLVAGLASGSGVGASAAQRAPTPEELAPHFPGLVIESQLGRGGMGVVYKARHKALDRAVALKVLPASLAGDPAFAERFQREARALAKLQHPNIVAVHDFGETAGLFWLVMEFVDGTNIRQAMAAGAIHPKEALAIVPQICDALQYAHEHGVVHRDIKPENVLLDRAGRVKVADFGLAKMMEKGDADRTLTGARQVMGTPHYMAPEQWEKPTSVDHRADIYSLGVVFYEMLTGELPVGRFAAPSKRTDVDARIDEIVLRTLEREREARYQRVDEVKTDVGRVAASPAPAAAAVGDAVSRPGSHAWLVAAGVVACAVAVVALSSRGGSDTVKALASMGGIVTGALLIGHVWSHRRHATPGAPRPHWAWWIALASLLLCGGPLAVFLMFAVAQAPTHVAVPPSSAAPEPIEPSRPADAAVRRLLTTLSRMGGDRRWPRVRSVYARWNDPVYLRADDDPRIAAEGAPGTLGLPLTSDEALGASIGNFRVRSCEESGDHRTARVVLEHGERTVEFGLVSENGEWLFTSDPVLIR